MSEKQWKVKDLIKYLADFNPNAIIDDDLDIAWSCYDGAEIIGKRDIEQEKADADFVVLMAYETENGCDV